MKVGDDSIKFEGKQLVSIKEFAKRKKVRYLEEFYTLSYAKI